MSSPEPRTYVESTIIMTTVRVVLPFVFTFGLFVMFHGAESSGGGFQGGAVVAASVLLIAFAFGIEPTREWLRGDVVPGLVVVGILTFVSVGVGAVAAGGAFLEYAAYGPKWAIKYGIELVELAIGAIVSGVIVALFFGISQGFNVDAESAAEAADERGDGS